MVREKPVNSAVIDFDIDFKVKVVSGQLKGLSLTSPRLWFILVSLKEEKSEIYLLAGFSDLERDYKAD